MFGLGLQFLSRSVPPLGAREELLPLSYQAESSDTTIVWDVEREMESVRRVESISSLQTKGARSLMNSDEFHSSTESSVTLALCTKPVDFISASLLDVENVLKFK